MAKVRANNEHPYPSYFVPPRTRASAAADVLRERILDGTYPGGLQLRQEILAEEFGISRIPLREALVQLETEGLVNIQPHKGAVVSELSLTDIGDLFELRSMIEPRLLELSAPLLTAGDYERIGQLLQEFKAELQGASARRWGEMNTALHGMLYQKADRPRMLALASQLLVSADRYTRMQLTLENESGRNRADEEHMSIVERCRSGDIVGAKLVLREHILNAGESLMKSLRKHHQEQAAPSPAA
jgi:DNA-binding GntR family transcriptional regulator